MKRPDVVLRLRQEPADPQADDRQPVLIDEMPAQILAERLGDAVERIGAHRLAAIDRPLAVAVVHPHDVIRRREDDLLHPGQPRRLVDVVAADDIRLVDVIPGGAGIRLARHVDDRLDPLHRRGDLLVLGDVGDDVIIDRRLVRDTAVILEPQAVAVLQLLG